MGYEDVDVTLRLRAIDETDRVMADAARRAKATTDAMVRGMSDVGKATLEASRTTQKLTEGLTAAGRAAQQFSSAASNMSAMTKAMGDYNISADRMARGMSQAGQAASQAAQSSQKFAAATSAQSALVREAAGAIAAYGGGFLTLGAGIDFVVNGYRKFAEAQRDMTRVKLDTDATRQQLDHLGRTFDSLAKVTGISTHQMQQDFAAFREQTGMGLEESEALFKRVSLAAHAMGASFEGMSRATVAALVNLKVPQAEVSEMLDTWVKTIPSSMMDTFASAAPRITQLLHGIGFEGKESAEQVASAFANLAVKLGNARLATQTLEEVFSKATDINNYLGMQTVPLIQRILGDPNETNKVNASWMAIYETIKATGVYDTKDLAEKSIWKQLLGTDERQMEAVKAYAEEIIKIQKIADKTGHSFNEVNRRVKELGEGPTEAANRLAVAIEKMGKNAIAALDAIGGTRAMKILAFAMETWNKIQELQAKPQKEVVGGWTDFLNKKYGFEGGKAAPGTEGMSPLDRLLHPPGAQKPGMTLEQQKALDAEIRAQPGLRGVDPGKVPGGKTKMATGGEFTVPGSGRGDDQPVSFMGTPGERVTVESIPAAATKESLQKQQDKADIALQEHFARFRTKLRPGAQLGSGWPHDRLAALGGGGDPAAGTGTGTGPGGTTPGGGGGGGDGKIPPTTPGTTPPAGPPTSGPGYNIGPYGQPMPAWGTHVTEGEDWGGGTGGGVAGGVPGLPGSPSGRALTKEERAAGGVGAGTGAGTTAGGVGVAGGIDRSSLAGQLSPALIAQMAYLTRKEVGSTDPEKRKTFLASLLNRTMIQTGNIKRQMENGYYPGTQRGAADAAEVETFKKNVLDPVMRGEGGDYTHNASLGVAARAQRRHGSGDWIGAKDPEYFYRKTQEGELKKIAALPRFKGDGTTVPATAATTPPPATGTGTGTGTGTTGTGGSSSYDADLQFMRDRGGHDARDNPRDTSGAIHPELARRLAQAGRDYEAANPGKKANYGEMYRDVARQARYRAEYERTGRGLAAKPGPNAPHQGRATDIQLGGFHDYLRQNASKYKVEFLTGKNYAVDPYHVQISAAEWETLKNQPRAQPGATKVAGPTTVAPAVPAAPTVPPFVPGRTQGLPGTPSGPAVRRPKGPDATHSTTLPDHDPGGLQDATPSRSAASTASAARRTAAAKSIAAVTPKAAADPAAKAIAKGKAVAGELAEGGTAGAGQDYLVGENGPEILSMGPRSGTVHHPGTGYTGPGAEFPEGHDPRAAGLQPGGIGPFGSDLDVALGFIPAGPASIAGKTAGASLLGKLGGIAGKFAGGQVEHQVTREGIAAGGGVLGAHREFEDRLDLLRKGSPGSQIQPIAQAHQDMREALGAPIEPIIRPRIQQTGPLSMRWSRQSERQRHQDISRDQARSAHVDQGFQ